ncbi:peptide/nickel transport system permease protein [Saccharomonospora amisosensis]|uniref:Peptide/nickel transport system permease protein n=1 Tax=Saccharomonospora amisosensis TaxID=1128677 RepID=A0A7X5ZPX9_9PSEU|nr:ABC transporter permease [Saccharomonospora amisosensis]NIJ10735.1 peptide/nickel transport system permease protein [Saccharomonospora amisosensis]
MLAYALRRFLISVPILIASTFVVFLMASLSGNPLNQLMAKNPPPPPHTIELERQRLNLDQPLLERYWNWLTGIFRGDFGPSVQSTMDIGSEVTSAYLVTLRLIAAAMLIALILAVIVGVVSAVKQYSGIDYTFTFTGFLFLAMPSFWFAILLKEAGISFNNAVGDQVLYTIGDSSVYVAGGAWAQLADTLGHMVLPTISLALISFAAWSRFQRGSMLEVLNSDYVRLARAKGLSRGRVMRRHALRTALIPLATVTALDLGSIISGAVVTETVFQWRGAGHFLLQAIQRDDVYAITAWLLFSATIIIVLNLVADLLYGVLDPRIRYA